MKTNYHTHSIWCDGQNTPEEMIQSAIGRGFGVLGFSSHSTYPEDDACTVPKAKLPGYFDEVRALAAKYAGRIRVLCGVEADYIPGVTDPDRRRYAQFAPDYIIGSVHYVVAKDGARVPVDHLPELVRSGIDGHFGGSVEKYLRASFAQQREMVRNFDFDIVGHIDLCRKFNGKHPYFDETAGWYREELRLTADAVAESGKLVELNTGAISRGWMDDVYPSAEFRDLLRERGVRFVLDSDSHAADTLDCAFDRFAAAENFVRPFPRDLAFRPEK
jgi:histidinol-phosphatase (PHP family)